MKGWLKNILLLVLSACISLGLGEVIVATFFPQNLGTWGMTRDGITSHVPNLAVYVTQFKQVIRTNSHGMRDREHALVKKPGTFRILILGDSFMEANQVPFEDSFASLLESKLKGKLSRDVEVVNASVSGWGTDDELTYLMRYGVHFHPDLVLAGMTLHNDIQDNLAEEFHSFASNELVEITTNEIPSVDYALLQVKEYLASHSHLYQVFLHVVRSRWMKNEANRLNDHLLGLVQKEQGPAVNRGWRMTQLLFRKMKKTDDEIGASTAIFLIPLWIQVSDQKLEDFLNAHGITKDQVTLDRPQREMKRIGLEEDLMVMDLLEEFSREESRKPDMLYLEGDGHWTAAGHRLAAEIVSTQIVASEILK